MLDARYPHADRAHTYETRHGRTVADPFRWLEDPTTPATKEWSQAQDTLFTDQASQWTHRSWFTETIRRLLGSGSVTPPVWRGQRRFVLRREPEQEHGVLYTVAQPGEREQVLIDPTALDPSGTTTLDAWRPDPTGRLLAYQLSTGGDEESLLRVLNVVTDDIVDGPIDRCRSSPIAWLPDGSAFYYVRRLPPTQVPTGEQQYHRRVYLHRLGRPTHEDVLVFGAGREHTEYYGVQVSHDGRWLTLTAVRGTAANNDAWIADLATSGIETPQWVPIQEGHDAEVAPHVRGNRLYLITDRDAPRGRLCVTDPNRPGYAHWQTLLPADPDAVLSTFTILDSAQLTDQPRLLAVWRRHAVSEISVHHLATGTTIERLPLPGLGSVTSLTTHLDGGHEAWFSYTDNATPPRVLRYDALAETATAPALWEDAPGRPALPSVHTEQVTYTSADGTPVRMLLLSPPHVSGPRPTILYGYGGFSISLTPGYSAPVLSWIRAGGSYAVANLRGGLEEGEEWHRAGMFADKQNVFDDCIAAAEHLIAAGVTTPDQLAMMGGSNGGLLVGAVTTQRPELFRAAVCAAPLLDMLRYERFGLGQLWSVEYGSAEDPRQFEWLLAYSPYHQVRAGVRYPATLLSVYDNDTRVDPMHARKMCAALQHASAASARERPVLLRREADVGHSTRSLSRTVALNADHLAFLAHHTGLEPEEPMTSTQTARTATPHASDTADGPTHRHLHHAQLRYADIDQQHHVNNVRMLTFLEDARITLLRWDEGTERVFGDVVVARQEADYLAPLLMRPEPVRVETWVTGMRRASFTLAYEIRDGADTHHTGPVYLRARTVLAGFDSATQRARRLTDAERAFLHHYLEPEDA